MNYKRGCGRRRTLLAVVNQFIEIFVTKYMCV
jgi:hypothetical protein